MFLPGAVLAPRFCPRLGLASELVAHAGADRAWIAIAVLVEAQLVAVFLVEDVIDIELRRQLFVDLITRHQVGYGIAAFAIFESPIGSR